MTKFIFGILVCFLWSFPRVVALDEQAGGSIYFTSALWPEEGIPNFRAKKDLPILKEPFQGSISTNRLKKGTKIKFTETQYQTLKPSSVTIQGRVSIEATDYGQNKYISRYTYYHSGKQIQLELKKGDIINCLQYRAEGTYFFEFQGKTYAGSLKPCDNAPYKAAWWVKISNGGIVGWILIDKNSVEFLPRSF